MKTQAKHVGHAAHTNGHRNAPSGGTYRSQAERRAEGKALRDVVPRARQLRDMKISADVENMDDEMLRRYADACGWALARAHARSGDPAMIAGYMGSGRIFDEAVCDFAADYADQAERDHRAFVKAFREGRVKAVFES